MCVILNFLSWFLRYPATSFSMLFMSPTLPTKITITHRLDTFLITFHSGRYPTQIVFPDLISQRAEPWLFRIPVSHFFWAIVKNKSEEALPANRPLDVVWNFIVRNMPDPAFLNTLFLSVHICYQLHRIMCKCWVTIMSVFGLLVLMELCILMGSVVGDQVFLLF